MAAGKASKKCINFIDAFHDIDKNLVVLLQKTGNGKFLDKLHEKEKTELWSMISAIIRKYASDDDNQAVDKTPQLVLTIDLLLQLLSSNDDLIENNPGFVNILKYLNSEEFRIANNNVKNSLSKLNEYWMLKIQASEEITGMEYITVKHLLTLCLSEKPLVSDIQRLSAIRKCVSTAPFEMAVPSLRSFLIKLVQNSVVVSSDHGQRFVAHSLTLSHRLMNDIHKTVMLEMVSCTKKKATAYGKVYVIAWHGASNEMKNGLVEICFKNTMEAFLKERRTSLELTKHSQNLLTMLEVWHSERKKKHSQFITMLTDAYQPIIWKYVESGFNVYRCNAADLFFKAFPLQRPDEAVLDAEHLFNMQYTTMLKLLTDDCHIVRIIAIREICNILSHYWNSFIPAQIQRLMTVISKEDASDVSCADVRRMVYVGFQSLVQNPLSFEYLKQVLPGLADNIHDVNQRVRIAFIQLLIAIQDKKDPNFKYSSVVPMYSLYYRLAEDNIAVGRWIVKLLISNYYHTKMPVVEWTKRFIFLINTYQRSYRNFFLYSNKILPFSDAFTIMCELLTQIGVYVMSKACTDQENEEQAEENVPEKRRRSGRKAPLVEVNRVERRSNAKDKEKAKECAFDDPIVVSGLFDIITILWVLHDKNLNEKENEDKRFKLYETYIKYAQPFISYYKDTPLFISVLSLSGNIPVSLLKSNSITLPGYCIKMLKSIKIERSAESNENVISMLMALVKWGRGSEILEQVSLWLDAAFETQEMNETILPRRRVKISETIQPDSIVAINILDTLLKTDFVKTSILKKNYVQLFKLWKFMSRIQALIEARLDQGEPFEEALVSDQFLKVCFRRFVKLIPLLKEDTNTTDVAADSTNNNDTHNDDEREYSINREKEIEKVITWSENYLFTPLQQDLETVDVELITDLLNDVLYVADNMVIVHSVHSKFYIKLGHFTLKLLDTSHGLHFVKSASRIATALNYAAKILFSVEDYIQLFSKIVPSIMCQALKVLTRDKPSAEDVNKLSEILPVLKTNFGKILTTYHDNFKCKPNSKENLHQLQLVAGLLADSVVSSISYEVPREDMSVPVYSSMSQLPPVAHTLFSLFYNRKFWGPMFVHVLNAKLTARHYECKSIIASILVLHVFAACDKKMNRGELRKALSSASKSLTAEAEKRSMVARVSRRISLMPVIRESATETEDDNDEPLSENVNWVSAAEVGDRGVSEGTTAKSKDSWPSNAATIRDSDGPTGTNVKENWPSDVATPTDTKRTTLKDQTDLDDDLLCCGVELIKNVENLLSEKQEVDDCS